MTEHSRRQHKPNRNKSTKSNDIKEMERFFKIAHIPKINLPDKKDTQDAKVIPSTPVTRDGFSVPEEEIQLRHGVLTVDQKEEMYGQWEVQAGRLLTFANKPVATIHRDANQGGEPVVLDKLVRILAAHLNETRQTPDTIYMQAMRGEK